MKVPFIDLKLQYNAIKKEIDTAIADVLNDSAFIKGKFVANFENRFSLKYGIKNCIGVANGTDALFIALKCLGVGPGDEVITTALSWISTSEVISLVGAKPIFVDIEEDYFTIDSFKIEAAITKKTKAIIPVHLYGQSANMKFIMDIARRYNLFVIEDCAQAHFAEFEGKRVGTFGDIATFSFYPGKNLGAYGDAGCIITNNDNLAKKVKMFANHGQIEKHNHKIEGINSRLDGIQAAVLSVKLNYIDSWNKKRNEIATNYSVSLNSLSEVQPPKIRKNTKHAFHLYVIKSKNRNELKKYLMSKGIQCSIHYPKALPFLDIYKNVADHERFSISGKVQNKILSLPIFPEMTDEQINYILYEIKAFYAERGV